MLVFTNIDFLKQKNGAILTFCKLPEEGKDQSFIFLDFFLSLEFADEGLAALQSVHGPDESKKSILIGADGGNLSVSSETPLVSIAFFLLAAEAGGQEKSGSSQLEDAEDGDGSAEGAGGGGQEGDGQSTLVGNGGEGADTMDGSPGDGVKEKCQKSLAVHLFVSWITKKWKIWGYLLGSSKNFHSAHLELKRPIFTYVRLTLKS